MAENKIQKENVKIVSSYKTFDHIIEEIYDPLRVPEKQFAIYEKSTEVTSYRDKLELENGTVLIPNPSTLIDNEVILLPEEATKYTSEEVLVTDIRNLLYKYIDIHDFYLTLIPYYILLTWVFDRLSVVPYLRALGDYGTGKTRFVQVVGSLCYNPMFIAGAVTASPIFRIIEQFQGTMVFNEMDLSDNNNDLYSYIVKILNSGFEKKLVVIRTEGDRNREVRSYKTFSPKIFAMRTKFGDQALESRIISVPMKQTKRIDIPRLLPDAFWVEAKKIRNQLLMYRFKHVDELYIQEHLPKIDGIEPRLEQTLIPILSVIQDEHVIKEVIKYAHNFQEQIITDRSLEFDVIVTTKLIELFETHDKVTIKQVADEINKEFTERKYPYTPQSIGKIVRNKLSFKTKKIQGNFHVIFDADHIQNLKSRYGIESPQTPQSPPPDSDSKVDSVDLVDSDNDQKLIENPLVVTTKINEKISHCLVCKNTKFWKTKQNNILCAVCHPPISNMEVIEWINASE